MPNKMTLKTNNLKYILILIGVSCLLFMFGNNLLSLTSPDEVFYAQIAKEMVKHNSWLTPYLFDKPQFEKPIMLYWLLRSGFILFGVDSFGARFFPALFAALGVTAVYLLGLAGFKNEKKAFLAGLILMSCGLYVGLAKTVFTDMIFSVFILLSLLFFFWGYSQANKKRAGILLFFIFSGLAVLTKGPLGFLIPFLAVLLFLSVRKDIKYILCKESFLGFCIFALISVPWYAFMIKKYGRSFTHEFFYNDHYRRLITAEHPANDRWYFYPLSAVGAIFPWSLYVITALIYFFNKLRGNTNPFYIFLACWIGTVLLIFQPAHSKLVSYILPLFPALTLITADFIYEHAQNKDIFFISLVTSIIFFLIPVGLLVVLNKYSSYVPSKTVIYVLVSCISLLLIFFFALILCKKIISGVYTLMLFIPLLMFFLPFVYKYAEPYVSSQYACEYLLRNYQPDGSILCSKALVRGVRYYTDKEIVFVSLDDNNFFSPHPIITLHSAHKVAVLVRNKYPPLAYGVFTKSDVGRIGRVQNPEFKYTLLKVIGNEYLLKFEPNPQVSP